MYLNLLKILDFNDLHSEAAAASISVSRRRARKYNSKTRTSDFMVGGEGSN